MKKHIYTIMLILGCISFAQAQRMIPGQMGLEVNTGILSVESPGNYYLNVGLSINRKNGNYQLWTLEYTHAYSNYKFLKIPIETYTAAGGYSLHLLGDTRKNIALNTAFTAVVGYETVNRGKNILYDGAKILNKEGFIYGAGGRLSFETYLFDRITLLLQGRIKVLWETSLEQLRPSAGLGMKYNY